MILTKKQSDLVLRGSFLSLHSRFIREAMEIVEKKDSENVFEEMDRVVYFLWLSHCQMN